MTTMGCGTIKAASSGQDKLKANFFTASMTVLMTNARLPPF